MTFACPSLETILSKVLTLGKLRHKEEVVARAHWSQPGWKLEVPALSLAQGSVSCPQDFIPAQSSIRHTVPGGKEALLSPDSCLFLKVPPSWAWLPGCDHSLPVP